MDKFLLKRVRSECDESSNILTPVSASSSQASGEETNNKKGRQEFSFDDIIGDPALRKPIDEYDIEIRDDVRKQYLAKGACQPYGYNFPQRQFGKIRRSFRDVWFSKYEWLEYSISKDAAFCFWCYLFSSSRGAKQRGNVFTKTGFCNWKKAMEKFNDHIGGPNSPHNNAKIQYVDSKNQRQSEVCYRMCLTTVVDCIRFLLGQGLAFRGHDESENSLHRGNFLALLDWYNQHNVDIENVINSNAPKNNQLTSPFIQKQIVSACALGTTLVIIEEIRYDFYSILIDEGRDNSVKEQMAVILRYVNKFGQVVERFIGVVHVNNTSAQSLKSGLDDFFAKYGLSLCRVRGQGYSGTSNMRDGFNKLKTLILNENPQARYIHCFAQELQLVLVTAAESNRYVSSFFQYVSMIVNMVGVSCKRRDALRQKQHDEVVQRLKKGDIETGKGLHQETNLVRPGDTHWGSYYETIVRLLSMWSAVLDVLENISDDGTEQRNRGRVVSLVDKMESYEFVFITYLMRRVLGMTNDLSQALQRKDQSIDNTIHLITTVKQELQNFRENGWDELLEVVNDFCIDNDITVPNMEDNVPGHLRSKHADFPITYYRHFRVEIFYQVIDFIVQEMETRFTESSTELFLCIACLSPRNSFSNFNLSRLLRLAELYPDDFSNIDRMVLEDQLKTYIDDVKKNAIFSDLHDIGALAQKMVETEYDTVFPLVYLLIKLALLLPIATATVERAFSAMDTVKTDLRNKMGDDFSTDCLICYVEKDIFVKIKNETIMQRFQKMQTCTCLPSLVNIHKVTAYTFVYKCFSSCQQYLLLHGYHIRKFGLQKLQKGVPTVSRTVFYASQRPQHDPMAKKQEPYPQNVDLPPILPKRKKKPYPIPFRQIQKAARKDKKLAEMGIEKPLEPPKNGLLVPDLIPVAYEVLDAWKVLIKGVAQLLHVIPVYACSSCSEVHVAHTGHQIQDCLGPTNSNRNSFHSWIKGSINDVLVPIESYHLYDPFGKRIKHETRFDYDRIPAVVELCIQAGVDIPEYPSRRRTNPVRMIGKKVIDRGGCVEEPKPWRLGNPSTPIDFDTYRAFERFPSPSLEDRPRIAQETIDAYEIVRWGVRKLMRKYTVKACGYCSEVHVGPWGHNVKLCGEYKHQWRDGKHGWQDATVDEVFPPNYVWHVRDPNGPPLKGVLKKFYGKAPAVVEMCMQSGAQIPEKYKPMMRLDIMIPETDEAKLVA